jgi:hypothetical protein
VGQRVPLDVRARFNGRKKAFFRALKRAPDPAHIVLPTAQKPWATVLSGSYAADEFARYFDAHSSTRLNV